MAELIAFMAKNRSLSYCKVVEVIAETTAPLTPLGKLLEKIPSQRVEVYPSKVFLLNSSQKISNSNYLLYLFCMVERAESVRPKLLKHLYVKLRILGDHLVSV